MQSALCLTVPGLNGSDEDHWQSWAEREIPNCRRVHGIDFDKPVVAAWADAIRQEVRAAPANVILLAHSFGCLASVMAIADQESKVCALVLVAPASPRRFNAAGLLPAGADVPDVQTLMACVPSDSLNTPGVVVASSNDPWLSPGDAENWANAWGLRLICLENAGHINTASGFGRWHAVHQLIESLRANTGQLPLGELEPKRTSMKNRFSALMKARRFTRDVLQSL